MRKRILWLITSITILVAVLFGRLFQLMLFPVVRVAGNPSWTIRDPSQARTHVDAEHFHLSLVDDGRGRILYRDGQPCSGRSPSPIHDGRYAESVVGRVGLPDIWPSPTRKVQEQGRSGLEARFDAILQGGQPGYTGRLETSTRQAVPIAQTFRSDAVRGHDVRTTLDYAWQRTAQTALAQAQVHQGAVVLLDVRTGQVLAMVSASPHPMVNEAVRSVAPGSVFKLVTAMAALETHRFRLASRFVCTGGIYEPGLKMACWRVHGHESLFDALVQSCDTAFAEIGMGIGRGPIAVMANRLMLTETGLQRIGGKTVLPEAVHGQVFRQSGNDRGLLANTAIGQEDVRMSVLQGAMLAATIANHGRVRQAELVLDVERDRTKLGSYNHAGWRSVCSAATADIIADAMRKVVTDVHGTAHALYPLPVAAKTGTAELAEQGKVNAWLVGFVPATHPKLAFATVAMDVPSTQGHQQVRQIVRDITEAYLQFQGGSVIR